MKCSSRKLDGSRCRAAALVGQKVCHFHSQPGKAAEAGSKGGKRRAIYRAENLKTFPPARTPADLVEVAAQTLCDVRNGHIDAKVANAIAGLAGVVMKLFQATTFEERLARLEKFAEERRHGRSN